MEANQRVCQFFVRGRCSRANCEFKHVRDSSVHSKESHKKKVCKFFEKSGNCQFGDNCRFFHDESKFAVDFKDSRDVLPDSDSEDDTVISGFTEHLAVMVQGSFCSHSDKQDQNEKRKESIEAVSEDSPTAAKESECATKGTNGQQDLGCDGDTSQDLVEMLDPHESSNSDIIELINDNVTNGHDANEVSNESEKISPKRRFDDDIHVSFEAPPVTPMRKKRGRPPKDKSTKSSTYKNENQMVDKSLQPVKRKRGRPRKNPSLSSGLNSSSRKRRHSETSVDLRLELPEFDPNKFKPNYVPPIVKRGDTEYAVVVTGVKDTGLCGKYWGDLDKLPPRRASRGVTFNMDMDDDYSRESGSQVMMKSKDSHFKCPRRVSPMSSCSPRLLCCSGCHHSSSICEIYSQTNMCDSVKCTNHICPKSASEVPRYCSVGNNLTCTSNIRHSACTGHLHNVETIAADVEHSQSRHSASALFPINSCEKEATPPRFKPFDENSKSKDRFVPYDSYQWAFAGSDDESEQSVFFSKVIKVQNNLLSFMRIKGQSRSSKSNTKLNNAIFVVIEGDISVVLHTSNTRFKAQKGDSFHIPPNFLYSLINEKVREVELTLFQFQSIDKT